jgi:aminobenzoyl-glutamate transport protein
MSGTASNSSATASRRSRGEAWLAAIERLGNRLPDPTTLFLIGALLVAAASWLAAMFGWSVDKPGGEGAVITAQSLLSRDGIWWALSHLVTNFTGFAPLGVVLVGMLGIGVAEHSGLIAALLRRLSASASPRLLTPIVVFLGIMSSLGLDVGYVVLPPIAAALYLAAGRSPVVGIAAAYAGVAAGFSANLFITGVDPLLAGFTQAGAQLLDAQYRVAATANWGFMAVSTVVLTFAGWLVTARLVEPRYARADASTPLAAPPPDPVAEGAAVRAAMIALVLTLLVTLALIVVPEAPLNGHGERFPRWVEAIVPLLALTFLVPGIVYGWRAGSLRSDRDLAAMWSRTMQGMGSYIVLAFFASQFVEWFRYSHLGEMLAISGGNTLAAMHLSTTVLLLAFTGVVMLSDLFIASASAKYALFAPVFVPMLMQTGISPELTQAAYRVADSVTNVISPFNPYIIVILMQLQRHLPRAGIGTLAALMLPYTLGFALVWIALLLGWVALGIPLGPGGPLHYR